MREFRFHRSEASPIVHALLTGPKRSVKARLIFDTGAVKTQIRQSLAAELGFSAKDKLGTAEFIGAEDQVSEGPLYRASKCFVLGTRFTDMVIAAFPMKYLESEGIDGLLGWDVIQQFHLELLSEAGVLRVY